MADEFGSVKLYVSFTDITEQKNSEAELRARNDEYSAIVAQSGRQILRYNLDDDTALIFGNGENVINEIDNYPEKMISDGSIYADSIGEFQNFFDKMREGVKYYAADIRLNSKKVDEHWEKYEYTLICDDAQKPRYAVISHYDYTKLRQKELAYERWQKNLKGLLSEKAMYLEVNLTKNIIEREENLGRENALRSGNGLDDYVIYGKENITYKEDIPLFAEFFDRKRLCSLFKAGISEDHFRYRAIIGGKVQWYHAEVQMVKDPKSLDVKAFIAYTNIDEEMREKQKIADAASIDAMTGLLNHAAMEKNVCEALNKETSAKPFTLFMLDIDNFKQVNDTMGHQQGDAILIRVAEAVRGCFRADDHVCRFGGDEYMIFTCGADIEAVHNKAKLLLQSLQFSVGDITTSVSIGICCSNSATNDFETLYAIADRALYKAKRGGKNSCCILDAAGEVTVKTSGYEITDSVQLQMLLRNMTGGIVVCEAVGTGVSLCYTSPSLDGELKKLREAAPQNADLFSFIYESDRENVIKTLQNCFENGGKMDITHRFGVEGARWVRVCGERLPYEQGQNARIIAVISDVTEIKKASSLLALGTKNN